MVHPKFKTGDLIKKNILNLTIMNTQKVRRKLSSEFKAKIALEALKEKNSLEELAKKYEVHRVQISNWKKELLEKSSIVFGKPKQDNSMDMEKQLEKLYAQIGKLKVENDF
jgi:transposase-like protein